jgi:hypothetical protein
MKSMCITLKNLRLLKKLVSVEATASWSNRIDNHDISPTTATQIKCMMLQRARLPFINDRIKGPSPCECISQHLSAILSGFINKHSPT